MPKLYVKRRWGQGPRTLTAIAKTFGVTGDRSGQGRGGMRPDLER
ncbi:MAG: hypothetical protein GY926_01500 [bacterium]|nr:hypothetical protein [bacterium]